MMCGLFSWKSTDPILSDVNHGTLFFMGKPDGKGYFCLDGLAVSLGFSRHISMGKRPSNSDLKAVMKRVLRMSNEKGASAASSVKPDSDS
jgi:hypothetical protein